MLRVSIELIATDLPNYERNSDGAIKQSVDPVTGVATSVTNGTVQGTRAIIHVGVSQFAPENRQFARGNIMDDFREGSLAVNGKFLGEITRVDGSKEHPKSRLYPIMDLEVDSEGEFGNNIGLVLEVPTLKQVNPANISNVIKNKAFPVRVSVVEREDAAVRLDVLKSQELVEFSALLPTRVQLRLPPTTNKGAHCYGGNQRLRDNRRKDHDQGGGEGGDEGPQRNRPVRPARLSAGYTIRRDCGDKRPVEEKHIHIGQEVCQSCSLWMKDTGNI